MDEVPKYNLFFSQISDLDNEQLDESEKHQDSNRVVSEKVREMVS